MAAYHIDVDPDAGVGEPGDYTVAAVFFILCESNGPNDDRNSWPVAVEGRGGLCTTGENDATGVPTPFTMPMPGAYVRGDICDALTSSRMGYAGGALITGNCATGIGNGADCQPNPAIQCPLGRHDSTGWSAEVGAFTCSIWGLGATGGPDGDFAVYYDRLYTWWAYDGDGYYTPGDPAGVNHNGDGDQFDNDDLPIFKDNEDGFHGHVAAFVDPSLSNPLTFSEIGSFETTLMGPPNANNLLTDLPGTATGWGSVTNNCGSSPACPVGAAGGSCAVPYGPVVRAEY